MFPGSGHPQGDRLFKDLIKLSKARPDIGIQLLIWNRKKASCTTGWVVEDYNGTHPHDDHIHVELNQLAGQTLTRVRLTRAWDETFSSPLPPEVGEVAEGTVSFGVVERPQQNYVWRLNPRPYDVRWWINITARDNAKGWACFLDSQGGVHYLYPFDFTPGGGDPDMEWTIGPSDAGNLDVVAFLVYTEFGDAPVGVTGYWRRTS